MSTEFRIWNDVAESLRELPRSRLDLENRLETWLEQDISIVSEDLMVIGRQVETEYGGFIDLPCLDWSGDTVTFAGGDSAILARGHI